MFATLFRCEVRRIQDPNSKGEKTSFLLRMLQIPSRRRWTGNYFFYEDEDCRKPTYGLEMQGELTTKGQGIKFNFSTVKVAIYGQDYDKSFQKIYNRSCPGYLKPAVLTNTNTRVYHVDKSVATQLDCLKLLGLGPEEFRNAFFKSYSSKRGKVQELLLRSVNLRRSKERSGASNPNSASNYQLQWPLRKHDSLKCLTCAKVGLGKLKYPPKLSSRNSTSLEGAWGSAYCHYEAGVYISRFDSFAGNTFETTTFVSPSPLCQKPSFGLRTTGTLRKVGNSAEVPGGVVYEMAVQHAFLTVYTKYYSSVLNLPGNCGKNTWEIGKTQDLVPTKGCDKIGYVLGPPELVLIRTVRDENRDEMYFGIDPYGKRPKDGPVSYNYISKGCSNFPFAVTTLSPTVETTTEQFVFPRTDVIFYQFKTTSETTVEVLESNQPRSSSPSLREVVNSILACLLAFVLFMRFV